MQPGNVQFPKDVFKEMGISPRILFSFFTYTYDKYDVFEQIYLLLVGIYIALGIIS